MSEFTDDEHREQCRIAGYTHPAIHPPQGWCDRCRSLAFRFDPEWRTLEERGLCDGHGGMGYERAASEWFALGRPVDVRAFICSRANLGPEAN